MAPQRAGPTNLRVAHSCLATGAVLRKAVSGLLQLLERYLETWRIQEGWQRDTQSLGWKYEVQTTCCFPSCAISAETFSLSDYLQR